MEKGLRFAAICRRTSFVHRPYPCSAREVQRPASSCRALPCATVLARQTQSGAHQRQRTLPPFVRFPPPASLPAASPPLLRAVLLSIPTIQQTVAISNCPGASPSAPVEQPSPVVVRTAQGQSKLTTIMALGPICHLQCACWRAPYR